MDVGPHPKIALFLSLTLMNLVAVGIYIYGPSPINERKSSQVSKSESLTIKRRIVQSFDDKIVVESKTDESFDDKILVESKTDESFDDKIIVESKADEATSEQIIAEENQIESQTKSITVTSQPPAIEDSEVAVEIEPINAPDVLEINVPDADDNNLNVITLNKNFGNDSSKEGSDISLNDMCGHGAEMKYMPQDLGQSVTAVIAKSFQLIDTFNSKVVPAVEHFNEQIAKTARLENSINSSAVGIINTSICPAVVRMSDSINKMNEKINRVTENINRANGPKERSVSCQVSESLLVKSVHRKNSFFSSVSPMSEARIISMFGHMSCRVFSKRKAKPSFKTTTVQYWANRRKVVTKECRKERSRDDLQHIKTIDENIPERELAVDSCPISNDMSQQPRTVRNLSSTEILKEEVTEEFHMMRRDFTHDAQQLERVKSQETKEGGGIEVEMSPLKEDKAGENEDKGGLMPSTSTCERVPSLISKLPSYLSSSDESEGHNSKPKVKETSKTFQAHFFKNDTNYGSKDSKYGNESQDPSVCIGTGSRSSPFVVACDILNEKDLSEKTEAGATSDANKSLQLSTTVQSTIERICGTMKNRRDLHDVLDMLDPNIERTTVDNLFLLILKIFDAWSESQLTIVPSRALNRISPSESTCVHSSTMNSKSFDSSEGCIDQIFGSTNYSTCVDTTKSEEVKPPSEETEIREKEEETVNGSLERGAVEEALPATPKCLVFETKKSCQFDKTYKGAISNDSERRLKAILYKEQYSIARKIADECIETAISTSNIHNDDIHSSDTRVHELLKRKVRKSTERDDYEDANLRSSSEESFYSWAPGSSNDSYHECDASFGSCDHSEKCLKKGIDRLSLSKRSLIRDQEKLQPSSYELKEVSEEASGPECSGVRFSVSRPSSAVVLQASSIESWLLYSTSGDGVEIKNSHSELKSEEISEISSRPISYTTVDTSDVESNHSLLDTTASESSQIRRQWSSRFITKMKKKRPKTPKTAIAAEAPSHAQSDHAIKVAESVVSHNASLSDEN